MRFAHDCNKCVPLGEHGAADLYYCNAQIIGGETVIARYSSKGDDYNSGLIFAGTVPDLQEAKRRAVKAGLMGG